MKSLSGSRGFVLCAGVVLAGIIPFSVTCRGETAPAPRLRAETTNVFSRYAELVEARNAEELRAGAPVFWVDDLAGKERAAAYAALKRGEIRMQRLEVHDGGRKIECPHGMIHHWAGLVF